ncbi:hypothetical protein H8B15_00340 [Hymenobacter sp. BT507]|uniref:GGDEF domain-containing protein n=1 Tax=Hymenobacter citatus TaxID=2763506 RepID=A0ABR7ME79_9BACT|nr:hypothetical protein [Hymenobacter citatus]MBC6609351.1 hypothetical protein [Hymenobacter citatus]
MTQEAEKPKSLFGRILLLNLGMVLLLHVGREILAPQEGVFPLLFCLAFVDFMGALFFMVQGKQGSNVAACLLATLLVFIIGFSDCASHFHLDTR